MATLERWQMPLADGSVLPANRWRPHPHQRRAIERFFGVDGAPPQQQQAHMWSRREGKDTTFLHIAALYLHKRICSGALIYPTRTQGMSALWYGRDPYTGIAHIDQVFPPELVENKRDDWALLRLKNGSTFQLLSSDNPERVRGSSLALAGISEYGDPSFDKEILTAVKPQIAAAKGGLVLIGTPRGRNHWWKLFQEAQKDPAWFTSSVTLYTGLREDGSPVVDPSVAEADRAILGDDRWNEEYLCIPQRAFTGAYLAREMEELIATGRTTAPYDPKRPVVAAWDLGFADTMVCVLAQVDDPLDDDIAKLLGVDNQLALRRVSIIGCKSWNFTAARDALIELEKTLPYSVDLHVLPHDANRGDHATGERVYEIFDRIAGYSRVEVLRRGSVPQEIDLTRYMLRVTNIDEQNTGKLIEHLSTYRTAGPAEPKPDDPKPRTPRHNEASHFADATRALATWWALKESVDFGGRRWVRYDWSEKKRMRMYA